MEVFVCLYTTQKTQKAKKWHDGQIKFNKNNVKASLYSEGGSLLDSKFLKGTNNVNSGDEIDMEHHLVTIEEVFNPQQNTNSLQQSNVVSPSKPKVARRIKGPVKKRKIASLHPTPVVKIQKVEHIENQEEIALLIEEQIKPSVFKSNNPPKESNISQIKKSIEQNILKNHQDSNNSVNPVVKNFQNEKFPQTNSQEVRNQTNLQQINSPEKKPRPLNELLALFSTESDDENDNDDDPAEIEANDDFSLIEEICDTEITQVSRSNNNNNVTNFNQIVQKQNSQPNVQKTNFPTNQPVNIPQVNNNPPSKQPKPTKTQQNLFEIDDEEFWNSANLDDVQNNTIPQNPKSLNPFQTNFPQNSKGKEKDKPILNNPNHPQSNIKKKIEQNITQELKNKQQKSFSHSNSAQNSPKFNSTTGSLNSIGKRRTTGLRKPGASMNLLNSLISQESNPPQTQVLRKTTAMPQKNFKSPMNHNLPNTHNNNSTNPQRSNAPANRPFLVQQNQISFPIHKWTVEQFCWIPENSQDYPKKGSSEKLIRKILIPDTFQSLMNYKKTMIQAVKEDMNLQLLQLSIDLHTAYRKLPSNGSTLVVPSCPHGNSILLTVKKEGPTQGKTFYTCPSRQSKCKLFKWAEDWEKEQQNVPSQNSNNSNSGEMKPVCVSKGHENLLKNFGIKLYVGCELVKSSQNTWNKYNKRNDTAQIKKEDPIYLKLSWKENSSQYAKDDLWIISSSNSMSKRNQNDLFFIAKSIYHGPANSGMLQIKPIGTIPPLSSSQIVNVIHAQNNNIELAMLENLEKLDSKLPILPYLLDSRIPNQKKDSFKLTIRDQDVQEICTTFIATFKLNEDQSNVMNLVASWFTTENDQQDTPIILVHGVFGSGKSFLLVVIILFLCKLFEYSEDLIQILISSATNTAVDRILLGLQYEGFVDFIRVGSLKKIAKPILSHTLHRSSKSRDGSEQQEAIRELKYMLENEVLSKEEAKMVQASIDDAESGKMQHRKEQLKEVPVVGVTCAASVFSVLEGNTFPIVFLDESSQMVEPLSLLPLKFSCRKLITVGDPLQLPPTLQYGHISLEDKTKKITASEESGLGKTLFVRIGHNVNPVLLRTQYRCHPALSSMANKLFYQSSLLDGVSEADRSPVLDELLPIIMYDSDFGQEKRDPKTGSWYNEFEAKSVAEMISILLQRGVEPNQIGVITQYKAQVDKLREMIALHGRASVDTEDQGNTEKQASQVLGEIQISTVDAFQGAEKEIIILACTRTERLGFFDSPNRLNVAITRAKRHLLVVARIKVLEENQMWKSFVNHAKEIGKIQKCSCIFESNSLRPEM